MKKPAKKSAKKKAPIKTNPKSSGRGKKSTTATNVADNNSASSASGERPSYICANANCRLRVAGCYGAEGCPGFKSKA